MSRLHKNGHRFQFSVRTLVFITVIGAVVITWRQQWKQYERHNELQKRNELLQGQLFQRKSEAEFDIAINEVFQWLDMGRPKHRIAFQLLQPMCYEQERFVVIKRSLIGGSKSGLGVAVFASRSLVGGDLKTVAVLLHYQELVDVIHQDGHAELEDANQDGKLDVVFSPRCARRSIAYDISNGGFQKIEPPKCR